MRLYIAGIWWHNTSAVPDIFIPKSFLFESTFLFAVAIFSLLSFIIFYLMRYISYTAKRKHLSSIYSSFISEIILCETEEELMQVMQQSYIQTIIYKWLSRPIGKRLLLKNLIKIHRNMSGSAAGNIRWLYMHLALDQDSVKRLSSPKWHIKAKAIQELAEMKQEKYISKIYRETNNKNVYIRTEAQVAVVKLTGFEGLRFLNVVSQPITQWQQLSLLQLLSLKNKFQWDKLPGWLKSKNETVVEFALRLVEKYQRYEFHNEVVYCLEHPSALIRKQSIYTLKEISQPHTAHLLEHYFLMSEKEEQLCILEVMQAIGTKEQLPFLNSLLAMEDASIQYRTHKVIRQISVPDLGYDTDKISGEAA